MPVSQWLDYLDGEAFAAHVGLASNTLPPGASDKGAETSEGVYRGGLVLRESVVVSMGAYLRGLWLHMQQRHPQVQPLTSHALVCPLNRSGRRSLPSTSPGRSAT